MEVDALPLYLFLYTRKTNSRELVGFIGAADVE